jgi:hypothetical protein
MNSVQDDIPRTIWTVKIAKLMDLKSQNIEMKIGHFNLAIDHMLAIVVRCSQP